MPLPSVDFGLFIAYVLPGVVALYGLSRVVPALGGVFRATEERGGVGTAIVVTLLSILIGIALSITRGALFDVTFRWPIPWIADANPAFGTVPPVEPDYTQLIDNGKRESFKLAVLNEQRPYQFSGNAAMAVIVAAVCWVIGLPRDRRRTAGVAIGLSFVFLAVVVLYCGARVSHYRYAKAVAAVNAATGGGR